MWYVKRNLRKWRDVKSKSFDWYKREFFGRWWINGRFKFFFLVVVREGYSIVIKKLIIFSVGWGNKEYI